MLRWLLLATLFAFGCGKKTEPPSGRTGESAGPKTLRFGVIPLEGGANVKERFGLMEAHLEKELEMPVDIVTASDYAAVITAMADKHVEGAYFGPKSYVEAAKRAGAEVIVQELNKNGQPGYYGYIIARGDAPYKEVKDAKGAMFAFTDPNSTSGFLVPNILFRRDMKVKPEQFFKNVKFAGSHAAAILSVKNGSVDLAATNDNDFDRLVYTGQARQEDFKILWKSELIPGSALALRRDLPEDLKKRFATAMLKLNSDDGVKERMQNGGFGPAKDEAYDVVRYLMRLKQELK